MTDEPGAVPPTDGSTSDVDLNDEVHYPPVENGLDYMVSVVEHLRGDVDRRDLKYAVVHLQAAVECLLKYRLQLEHWSLVFSSPGDAVLSKLDDGSLISCTAKETRTRLVNIAGVAISAKEDKDLTNLAKLRNQLQHYGRPHDTKVNRYVIEANAADVLEFLVHFVDKEVLPNIAPPEGEIAEDLRLIREGLDEIRGFVTARMRRLRPQLDPVKPRTVQCPDCRQFALVVGDRQEAYCRYCHYRDDLNDAAQVYRDEVLALAERSEVRGGLEPVEWCPTCDAEALVRGAFIALDPTSRIDFCFHCGETFAALGQCDRCGEMFVPTDDETFCARCLPYTVNGGS